MSDYYAYYANLSDIALNVHPHASDSNRLPFLPDYDAACKHYHKVKPVRTTGERPMHLRRYKEREITMTPENHGIVTYRCYGNDVVKWLPDGQIHLDIPTWNLMQEAITYLLGVPIQRERNAMWLLPDNMDKYVKLNDGVTVCRRTSEGLLTVSNLDTRYRYFIRRKEAKKVRDIYKPFVDRVVRNIRLRDEGYSLQEIGDTFGYQSNLDTMVWHSVIQPERIGVSQYYHRMGQRSTMENSYEFLEQVKAALQSNDVEALYKLELQAIWSAHTDLYMRTRMHPSEHDLYKLMQEVVFLVHRDEVFEQRPVKPTDSTHDRNARFFDRDLGEIVK